MRSGVKKRLDEAGDPAPLQYQNVRMVPRTVSHTPEFNESDWDTSLAGSPLEVLPVFDRRCLRQRRVDFRADFDEIRGKEATR
jgi:hypothetical protein